jgi:hypothetical protein
MGRAVPRPASKDAHRVEVRERTRKALELRRAGANYDEIARQLGLAKSTVHAMVHSAMREITREPAEELRNLELQRLDAMMMGLWPNARKGDATAVTAVLRVMERRAKLLGLDAVVKHELTGPDGGPLRADVLNVHAQLLQKIARLAGDGAVVEPRLDDASPSIPEAMPQDPLLGLGTAADPLSDGRSEPAEPEHAAVQDAAYRGTGPGE